MKLSDIENYLSRWAEAHGHSPDFVMVGSPNECEEKMDELKSPAFDWSPFPVIRGADKTCEAKYIRLPCSGKTFLVFQGMFSDLVKPTIK